MKQMSLLRHICKAKAVCTLLTAFALLQTLPAMAESIVWGNCNRNIVTYLPVNTADKAGAALFYPEETMQAYQGSLITELHIALNSPTETDAAKLFITHSLNETPDYEQTFTATKSDWNTVVLNTPYPIDGKAIYIGYEVSGQRYLLYGTPFVRGEEWICQNNEGWTRYEGTYSAALYATLEGDRLPTENALLASAHMPAYITTGTEINVNGEFKNLGTADINELTFTLLVDGEEHGIQSLSNLKVGPRQGGTYALQMPGLENEGAYRVELCLSAVNGKPDAVPSDNRSNPVQALCQTSFTPRKLLLELFSTERCTGCPGAHIAIAKELKDADNVVEIGHHAGFFTDQFSLPESTELEWFYAEHHLFAPGMMIDRTNFEDRFPAIYNYNVPVVEAKTDNLKQIRPVASSLPAFTSLNLQADTQVENRKLTIRVNGEQLLPLPYAAEARLNVWLTEDSLFTDKQAGASEGFYHRHTARQCLTDTWGKAVDLPNGFDELLSADIPAEWNLHNMRVVAFISLHNEANKNECRVLNAEAVRLIDPASGIFQPDSVKTSTTYNVYTLQGVRILTQAEASELTSLEKGIYIVNGKKWMH